MPKCERISRWPHLADFRFANRLWFLHTINATALNRETTLIAAEAVARVAYSRSAAGTAALLQR
jgi:hypothetical protein